MGAAKAQQGNDALVNSAPPQVPRHPQRRLESKPAALSPSGPANPWFPRVWVAGLRDQRPQQARRSAKGIRVPQPRPKTRSSSGTRREGRGGAGPRCHWLPAAGGGLSTQGFAERRCCGGVGAAWTPARAAGGGGRGGATNGAEGEGVSDEGTALEGQRVGGSEDLEWRNKGNRGGSRKKNSVSHRWLQRKTPFSARLCRGRFPQCGYLEVWPMQRKTFNFYM